MFASVAVFAVLRPIDHHNKQKINDKKKEKRSKSKTTQLGSPVGNNVGTVLQQNKTSRNKKKPVTLKPEKRNKVT